MSRYDARETMRMRGTRWHLVPRIPRERYADVDSRPALRRANVVEETGLHVDCGADARPGHWREYGDFQRGECVAAAPVAICRIGAVGVAVGKIIGGRAALGVVPELRRLAGAGAIV